MRTKISAARTVLLAAIFFSCASNALASSLDADLSSLIRAYNADPDRYKYTLPKVFGVATTRRDYASEALALAKSDPSSEGAEEALIWLFLVAPNDAQYVEACKVLETYHLRSAKLDQICLVPYFDNEAKENLLSRLSKVSPHKHVRGNATYVLALSKLSSQPELAEKLLKRTVRCYFSVPLISASKSVHLTLGTQAENKLYDLRHFAVGCKAQPISGRDMNGTEMNLKDFRGQIVMLVFFGHWCRPCRALYPHEQSIMRRFESRHFTILGVNSDSAETLKKLLAEGTIRWPCWLDGGDINGPIARQWHVNGWPAVFIIDGKGVIRYTSSIPDEKAMSACISKVLSEMKL